PASASGACRSWRSIASAATRCYSRSGSSSTWRGSSARAPAPMSGTRERRRACCRPARAAPDAAATASARRPTSLMWGSAPAAAGLETRPELRWPAELYLEGSDQHRGWFHSSLLEAIGTRNAPPYKSVLTCGFVVDGEGRKMSKSLGNGVEPDELLPKYGAEVLRLWVAAEDYTEDIRLSTEILDRLADAYRRMRDTFRFLLGHLHDFEPARDREPYARLDEVDRWILDRLARLVDRVRRAYEEYQFHTVFHSVHNFCAVDLSALYLDVIKDRLYTSAP